MGTHGDTNYDFSGAIEVAPIVIETAHGQIGRVVWKFTGRHELRRDRDLAVDVDKSIGRRQLFARSVDAVVGLDTQQPLVKLAEHAIGDLGDQLSGWVNQRVLVALPDHRARTAKLAGAVVLGIDHDLAGEVDIPGHLSLGDANPVLTYLANGGILRVDDDGAGAVDESELIPFANQVKITVGTLRGCK